MKKNSVESYHGRRNMHFSDYEKLAKLSTLTESGKLQSITDKKKAAEALKDDLLCAVEYRDERYIRKVFRESQFETQKITKRACDKFMKDIKNRPEEFSWISNLGLVW